MLRFGFFFGVAVFACSTAFAADMFNLPEPPMDRLSAAQDVTKALKDNGWDGDQDIIMHIASMYDDACVQQTEAANTGREQEAAAVCDKISTSFQTSMPQYQQYRLYSMANNFTIPELNEVLSNLRMHSTISKQTKDKMDAIGKTRNDETVAWCSHVMNDIAIPQITAGLQASGLAVPNNLGQVQASEQGQ